MGMPAELHFKGGSDSKICFEIAVFLFSNFLLEVLPESFSQKFSMTFSVFWSNSTVPLLVEVFSSDQRQLHKTCNLAQPLSKIVSAMVFKKMDMIGYVSVR